MRRRCRELSEWWWQTALEKQLVHWQQFHIEVTGWKDQNRIKDHAKDQKLAAVEAELKEVRI